MAIAGTRKATMQGPSTSVVSLSRDRRFERLRGVRWRINLGILPSSPTSSIDDLRRVTADSRRRYAALRRRLLVDPHLPKEGSNSPDLAIDNPLSQNPDSTWGRFFRNAELEKTLDQDLSRLYPEHGSYFQSLGCQGMLRRIHLLWCLRHPEFGYRQGMHELLAPLLYVLHVDVEYLSEVRRNYEDHFTDMFDELAFQERDAAYNFDFKKFLDSMEDEVGSQGSSKKPRSLNELDPEIQTIVLLSDAYGAEGELGIVLSEKFMEHDAYSMFDALMNGPHGSVSMADFYTYSPPSSSIMGLPPIIEASTALYHLLSLVDASLHGHLVELGVEPQYFALRWLRVLFGREFSLGNLLIVWDEIFSAENSESEKGGEADYGYRFRILSSPRGALITAIAVSMILYLRSSLLGTENATSSLQRLLNFPEDCDLRKIIGKAKSLQTLALNINTSHHPLAKGAHNSRKAASARGHSLSLDSISLGSPVNVVPDSYWEEKWRVLNKAEEEQRQNTLGKQKARKKSWSERVKLRISRTESDPSPAKVEKGKKENKPPVRRSLLDDLSRRLSEAEETAEKSDCQESPSPSNNDNQVGDVGSLNITQTAHHSEVEENKQAGSRRSIASDELLSRLSETTSAIRGANYDENDSEKSSAGSNFFRYDSNDHEEPTVDSPLPEHECKNDSREKPGTISKDRRLLSGKFQWLWKFGRHASDEEISDKKGTNLNSEKPLENGNWKSDMACSSTAGCLSGSGPGSGKEDMDQNMMGTLRNVGQSMLEHIQVIESVFQQDRGQMTSSEIISKNGLVEKGQLTAVEALKGLRRISSLLSEM